MERLPLASVRTFAVVARLSSISRAAEELSVTPSAVSHQIRILEEFLGVALFHRQKNRLKLTAAGERYMSETAEALQILSRATKAIKTRHAAHVLRIGVPPSLAALWLVPRLASFTRAHPDISLTIIASPEPAFHIGSSFDAAIWYGHGTIAGLSVDSLGRNRVFPICKSTMTTGPHALREPSDLKRCTLLDSADEAYHRYPEPRQPRWAEWLSVAGASRVNGAPEMNLTPRLLMHTAVTAGLGVGLSRSLLAVDALAAGEIAVPFGPALPLALTYNFVASPQHLKRKDLAALREWMLAQAATSHRDLERLLTPYTPRKSVRAHHG